MKQKLGFLGLGIMGEAMALNLVKAGFNVTVWNRTASKCRAVVAAGAKKAQTPADVIKACDITFAMVSDPDASMALLLDEGGCQDAFTEGKSYIEMSTIDADASCWIEEMVNEKGGRYLEAPVSGSKKPAVDGSLVFLAAGDQSLYEEAIPAFNAMGKKNFYLGTTGNGANMKLVVNMTMGSMFNAFAEGLALADASGLSASKLLEVLDMGAIANPMFQVKGKNIIEQNYEPAFPLKHTQKDLRLALALGDELALSLPSAAVANETFKRARSKDLGEQDFSAAYQVIGDKIKNK